MHLEVEQKFHVQQLAPLRAKLASLGTVFDPPIEQADTYFAHPARDFAATDEALRLRRVGEQTWITYKGPKLDPVLKTRRELELPLPAGGDAFERHGELLAALGFRPVATVHKRREPGRLTWHALAIQVALDTVAGAGQFIELEISADPSGQQAAQAAISSLANYLGLTENERRSYLELLLGGASRR
jgi:adenylate cyclase, class 2